MIHDTAIALSIVALTAAMLYMIRADNRRKARAEAEYQAMKDRHIGNALAALYREVPERASSRNSYQVQNEIREARARGILAARYRDGLPY